MSKATNGQGALPTSRQSLQKLDEVFSVADEVLTKFPHSKRVGNYLVGKTLGEGAFAKVKLGMHVTSGMYVAIKIICKDTIKNDAYMSKHYRREPKLLQLLLHPNVVQLYEVLETDNSLYLVLELCDGGDVVQLLKHGNLLTEAETRKFVRQLLSAVEYIHRVGVLHRDLKAENFLLATNGILKITDFGLSTIFRKQVTTVTAENQSTVKFKEFYHQTQCGSPAYASPEVLSQQAYCQPADVWSLGVNMFYMLHNKLPFMVEPFSMHALLKKVRSYDIEPIRSDLSRECTDFLRRLLCLDEHARITIAEAMVHPWITRNQFTVSAEPLEIHKTSKATVVQNISRTVLKYVCMRTPRAKLMNPVDVIQIISSNTPHELNAVYHLYFKKLSKYCELHSITIGEFEAREDVKQIVNQTAILSQRGPDVGEQRNGVGSQYQKAQVTNRHLKRPQANKPVLLKVSSLQTISQKDAKKQQPVTSVQPTESSKANASSNANGNSLHASIDHLALSSSEQNRVLPGGSTQDAFASKPNSLNVSNTPRDASADDRNLRISANFKNSSGLIASRNTARGNLLNVEPVKSSNTSNNKLVSPVLPDVNERSNSTPATPTLSRRNGKSIQTELNKVGIRRMSVTGGATTKQDVSLHSYMRKADSTNRVDLISKQRTSNIVSTASRNRIIAPPPSSQRSVQLAHRLTTDFHI